MADVTSRLHHSILPAAQLVDRVTVATAFTCDISLWHSPMSNELEKARCSSHVIASHTLRPRSRPSVTYRPHHGASDLSCGLHPPHPYHHPPLSITPLHHTTRITLD